MPPAAAPPSVAVRDAGSLLAQVKDWKEEQAPSKEVDPRMSGSDSGTAPTAERRAWLRDLRRVDALLGVDHASALLANANATFPQVATEQRDLQELAYQGEFDGVLCVDAMEFVPPEEWPAVLERFHRALRPPGWLYLTVELAPVVGVQAANQAARQWGLPVVDGEVIWEGADGYYHHYPSMGQVRAWLAAAGFTWRSVRDC